jgi:hypothetical protein
MKPVSRHTASSHRAGGRARRPLGYLLGLTAAGLLISGCGGTSPTSPAGRPSAATTVGKQFVAFAVCMRSHGVPDYPDPQVSSSGIRLQVTISPGSANPNSPAFKSADGACHNLMPDGGEPANGAQDQAQDVTFADCMRSHGVPNFPDVDRDGAFTLPSAINQQAPQFEHATHACAKVEPSSLSILQASGGA